MRCVLVFIMPKHYCDHFSSTILVHCHYKITTFAGIEIPLSADKYEYVMMENASVQYRVETEDAVHTSLLQEYVDDHGEPPAMQLISLSEQLIAKYGTARGRAMHLGCATGRASFALATIFKQVINARLFTVSRNAERLMIKVSVRYSKN